MGRAGGAGAAPRPIARSNPPNIDIVEQIKKLYLFWILELIVKSSFILNQTTAFYFCGDLSFTSIVTSLDKKIRLVCPTLANYSFYHPLKQFLLRRIIRA
jgi:hypothetical protein